MRGVEWTRSVWTFREDQRRRGMQRPLTHTSGSVWAAPCRRESYPEGRARSTARRSATAVTSQKRLFSAENHAASRQSPGPRMCDSSISARAVAPIRIEDALGAQRRVMPMTVRAARRCRRMLACLFRVLPLHVLPLRAPPPGRVLCTRTALARHASCCTAQAHVRDRLVVRQRGPAQTQATAAATVTAHTNRAGLRHAKAARVAAVLR